MYKIFLLLLATLFLGLGLTGPAFLLQQSDYQMSMISQDTEDNVLDDVTINKAPTPEIPEVGHEPLPPPPPPPDDDDYVLVDLNPDFP